MSSTDKGNAGEASGSATQPRGAYPPVPFRETRREVLEAFIRANPFGQLITAGAGGLQACGAPFVLRQGAGGVWLEAHVARVNPLASRDGAEALVLFQGPHAYIRPAWYPAKARDGRVVPTWNYIVVRARGVVSIVEDPAWLRALLDDLTAQQEAGFADPWSPADAPADYVEKLLRGIVGVRLDPVEIEGVWKLNQNHPRENRLGVVAGLSALAHPGAAEIADAMTEGEEGAEPGVGGT